MDRAMLERPFPQEVVKTRRGNFGKDLSYVEGTNYIERLNEAFDGEWSWTILGHEEHGREVVVHGVLEAAGVRKHAFGGSTITTNSQTGEIVSVANDLKAAATDALKKACSLLGVGLELYGGLASANGSANQNAPRQPLSRDASWANASGNAGHSNGSQGNARHSSGSRGNAYNGGGSANQSQDRLTARQLKCIYARGNANRMTDHEIKSKSVEMFTVVPEYLTRSDASALIDELGGQGQ